MALKTPTGPGHGVYKDTVDYGIFCGEWCIGRIYETRIGSEQLRWFWALHAPSKPKSMRTSNQAATLDSCSTCMGRAGLPRSPAPRRCRGCPTRGHTAKAEFEASWKL
jgi:hypothetical protein